VHENGKKLLDSKKTRWKPKKHRYGYTRSYVVPYNKSKKTKQKKAACRYSQSQH
jgi:hypothetical protein